MMYRIVIGIAPESSRAIRPSSPRLELARKLLVELGFRVTKLGRFSITMFAEESRLGAIGMPPGKLRLGVHLPTIEDSRLSALVSCVEVIPIPLNERPK